MPDRDPMVRAADASGILAHPEFKAAVHTVRESLIDRIEQCPIRDIFGLIALRMQLKLLRDVQANLQSVVNTGKVLEHERSLMDRMKRRIGVGR